MFIEHFKGAKIHWFSLLSPEPEPGALSAWSQLSDIRWFGSGANSGNHSQLGLGLTTGMSWLHDGLIAAHHHILICHSGDSKSEELCVSCWEESRLRDARTHNSVAHIIALRGFHSVPFHFMLHYYWDFKRGWFLEVIFDSDLFCILQCCREIIPIQPSTLADCKGYAKYWIEH